MSTWYPGKWLRSLRRRGFYGEASRERQSKLMRSMLSEMDKFVSNIKTVTYGYTTMDHPLIDNLKAACSTYETLVDTKRKAEAVEHIARIVSDIVWDIADKLGV